jgi:large subunit ribosomal protein L21
MKRSDVLAMRRQEQLDRSQLRTGNRVAPPAAAPVALSETTRACLDSIRTQGRQDKFYAILELNTRPFSVVKNDVVVTKRLPGTDVGDILTLTNVREIGSKDFFVRGEPLVDARFVSIKAIVLEQPWSAKYVTFRRRFGRGPGDRKWRKRSHRDHLSILRIVDIDINDAAVDAGADEAVTVAASDTQQQ